MATIKLETNDLKACAEKYKTLAESFNDNCNSVLSKISEYDNVWKGTFTQDLDEKVKKLKSVQKSIYSNSIQLADFINKAVEQYIKVDRDLAEQSSIGTTDYPDNVKVSWEEKVNQLKSIYPQGMKWDASNIAYEGSGCYAFAATCYAYNNNGNAPTTRLTNQSFDNIQVGDMVHYIDPKDGQHWVYVIAKNENGITVGEGNFDSSVNWGRTISKDYINSYICASDSIRR